MPPLAAAGGAPGGALLSIANCAAPAPWGRGAAAAAPALFQGGRRRSTPGPARPLQPRSPASLGCSSGMAEPGRLSPAAGGEGAADEFRDVIRSRSGRHRAALHPSPGRAGVPAQPQAGSEIQPSGVLSVGALRNYFLYWLNFSSRRAALEGFPRRLAGRIAHLGEAGGMCPCHNK